MVIVPISIMVCVGFVCVVLARNPRKKPRIENQTTKRCPYRDCDWWITFKDLNDEVRQLYRRHLETHKEAPQINFEDIGGYPLLKNQLSLGEKRV
jgi:hypothetical protein